MSDPLMSELIEAKKRMKHEEAMARYHGQCILYYLFLVVGLLLVLPLITLFVWNTLASHHNWERISFWDAFLIDVLLNSFAYKLKGRVISVFVKKCPIKEPRRGDF